MIFRTIALLLIFSAPHLYAKSVGNGTPDNRPPGKETACDVTKDATPGLYGLCVSFCEAQDFSIDELDEGLDDADFKKLELAKSLLQKYNAKKATNDPDMPCARQDGGGGNGGDGGEGGDGGYGGNGGVTCPCWTDTELSLFENYARSQLFCITGGGGIRTSLRALSEERLTKLMHASAGYQTNRKGDLETYCGYSNEFLKSDRIWTGITEQEAAYCRQQIDDYISDRGIYCESF